LLNAHFVLTCSSLCGANQWHHRWIWERKRNSRVQFDLLLTAKILGEKKVLSAVVVLIRHKDFNWIAQLVDSRSQTRSSCHYNYQFSRWASKRSYEAFGQNFGWLNESVQMNTRTMCTDVRDKTMDLTLHFSENHEREKSDDRWMGAIRKSIQPNCYSRPLYILSSLFLMFHTSIVPLDIIPNDIISATSTRRHIYVAVQMGIHFDLGSS
jgi:hypothetical protein